MKNVIQSLKLNWKAILSSVLAFLSAVVVMSIGWAYTAGQYAQRLETIQSGLAANAGDNIEIRKELASSVGGLRDDIKELAAKTDTNSGKLDILIQMQPKARNAMMADTSK
jgi:hypothetical protein